MTSIIEPARGQRRRPAPIELVTTIGVAFLFFGVVPIALLAQRHAAVEKARRLEVGGPPCQRLSAAAFASADAPALQTTNVGGVLFARRYGYVVCDYVATDHGRGLDRTPICRFNNPTLLAVTTPRGRFYFHTGVAPATVTLAHDEPGCVLNAAPKD
jgi:hypothetical protein